MSSWRSSNAWLGWVVAATAVCYLPSLNLDFVSDDFNLIEQARHVSPMALFDRSVAGYYRPIVQLSFWTDFALWSNQPFGYHLTNFVLHLANTVLVCLIARQGSNHFASLAAGLYFGLTPTHASSVLWICGRTDLLCATFFLLSLYAFLRSRTHRDAFSVLSAVALLLALLCKEMALSLPLLGFIISWVRSTEARRRARGRDALVRSLPLILVVLLYLGVRYAVLGVFLRSPGHESVSLVQLLTNVPRYAVGLLVPIDLELIKPYLRANRTVFLAAAAVSAVVGAVVARRLGRDRRIAFLLLCTAIALLPVVRLYAPWYLYIPSVGVALLFGRILEVTCDRFSSKRLGFAVVVFAAIHLIGLIQAQSWAGTAGTMARRTVDTLKESVAPGGRAIVLVAPSEFRSVPVFGWMGNVDYAMRLADHRIQVSTVVGLRTSETEPSTTATRQEDGLVLDTGHETDFFRIQDLAVLTGAVRPDVGQRFGSAGVTVEVLAKNASGHPSRLKLTGGSLKDPELTLFYFSDGELKELRRTI